MRKHPLGIYEKAMPADFTWEQRFKTAKDAGYDFVEISVDESDVRLARLEWSTGERLDFVKLKKDFDIAVPSMCLSGHRKYPFGSHDPKIRERAHEIMKKGIELAVDIGVRTIQLAGYDVYYEKQDQGTFDRYTESMQWAVEQAAAAQVMLATEIMDTPFMSSITKWKYWDDLLKSPWFSVYPDVGNLTAWGNDVLRELEIGIDKIAAIHLKETKPVTADFEGQFRDLQFGEGTVDFISIFKKLKELNYRGTFLLEMWADSTADPIASIVKAREFIESRMDEAGFEK